MKLLLEKGFDPNVQNSDNKSTPLHLAVKNDNDMAVRILAQSPECDVNLQVPYLPYNILNKGKKDVCFLKSM